MEKSTIKISSKPDKETLTSLLEMMTYSKLSYPVGEKDFCRIQLNDKENKISTPTVDYKCTDDIYLMLYLLSNKIVALIYKTLDDEINTTGEA